jgi:hypothetical protein
MRHLIKGMIAAFAVMTAGAAPAMACGYGGCCGEVVSPCGTTYAAPVYTYEPAYTYAPTYTYNSTPAYSGCGGCGTAVTGWGYEHLAEPSTQYYYVNQGPYYSGPGAFAPEPTYQEDAAPTYYGYHHHYRPYGYGWHNYGYAHHPRYFPHHWGYRYSGGEGAYWGHHVVRRYY